MDFIIRCKECLSELDYKYREDTKELEIFPCDYCLNETLEIGKVEGLMMVVKKVKEKDIIMVLIMAEKKVIVMDIMMV